MTAPDSLRGSHSVTHQRTSSNSSTSSPEVSASVTHQKILSSSRSSVLPLEFEDESLRRGTTLPHILSSWGKHLKMSSHASDQDLAVLAAMSRDVARLDEFISHTWSDSATAKMVALCLYYNGRAAAALSIVASLVAFGLAVSGVLPTWQDQEWTHKGESFTEGVAHWSSVAGTLVFVAILGAWHHVPGWLGGPRDRHLFFDKFCIDQNNHQRQNAGIQSLSAFIACSDRSLLLWSPNYFKRLWCTFELATFVRVHRARNSQAANRADGPEGAVTLKDFGGDCLDFKPLHLAVHVLAIYGTSVGCILIFDTVCAVIAVYAVPPLLLSVASQMVPGVIFIPVHMHAWRRYARSREALGDQLVNFEIESASCSREEDRRAIYDTVEHWFGRRRKFNHLVQNGLRTLILKKISGDHGLPLNIVGYIMLPVMYHALDWSVSRLARVSYLRFSDTEFGAACIIYSLSLTFVPIALVDIWATFANTRFALAPRPSMAFDILLSVVLCLPGLLFYTLYTLGNIVFVRPLGPLPQLGSFCGLLALICAMRVLFRKMWARQMLEISAESRQRQEWEQKVFEI